MSFSNLPFVAVIAGAMLLAIALFALQFLRPRTKVVTVATAQFWQQAAQQAPARVLWQKFHYWLALLLSIAIALLLWGALSGMHRSQTQQPVLALYFIDNSVAMQANTRLRDAKKQLLQDVAISQAEQRQVWVGDASAMLLLDQQDNNALLGPKLVSVAASAHQSVFQQWLSLMLQQHPTEAIKLYYYGAPFWGKQLAELPSQVTLHPRYLAPALSHNLAIVSLGQAPAQSGLWGKVDVSFGLYASDERPLSANMVQFSLDGYWLQPTDIRALGDGKFMIRDLDVASAPQQLQLTLASDDEFSADNTATLTLASMPVIKLQLASNTPAWLHTLVRLDRGVTLVDADADVAVCLSADNCPSAKAQLLLDESDNLARFVVAREQDEQDKQAEQWQAALAEQWQQNGWQTLAEQQQFPPLRSGRVTMSVARQVHFSAAGLNQLLEQQSADLPKLISQALRWLANQQQFTPYLSVAEPWPQTTAAAANALSPTPLVAGIQTNASGKIAYASMLAPSLSMSVSASVTEPVAAAQDSLASSVSALSMLSWGILLAAVLLLLEWALLQRGRLP
ncbi:BatA domain-containing protein [Shewanella avicenniae]|uniref:BatA domain-containing protein n=1 Tax=Shewanella avicenniae TaxID=2814294 RepID=A0ABX7QRQ8_9GAMM|nr:BatA domain-containing protein [Shewanella avicenniae]QSX34143.1 BatA domain-containing protein [Shewanella avicenniae]